MNNTQNMSYKTVLWNANRLLPITSTWINLHENNTHFKSTDKISKVLTIWQYETMPSIGQSHADEQNHVGIVIIIRESIPHWAKEKYEKDYW